MNLNGLLNDVLSLVRDLVVYSDTQADARSRALVIYSRIDSILNAPLAEVEVSRKERFALALGATTVWCEGAGIYALTPARTIFFIDGFITESKILAIKQVRSNDGCGLKEAKDYCDALAAKPRILNQG
jgi:ribosomal protein L7/L12